MLVSDVKLISDHRQSKSTAVNSHNTTIMLHSLAASASNFLVLHRVSKQLCHHTTALNADVPNCYTTLKIVICNKLSDDLINTQITKMWFISRIISLYNSSVQNCQNLCSKCAPRRPTRTQALRQRRRHWLIEASTIDWSNCAHSSIRRVLSSSTSAILERQTFYRRTLQTL